MTSKFEQKINAVEWLLTDGATGTNLFDMGLMSGMHLNFGMKNIQKK